MRGIDDDFIPKLLKSERSVDYQTFGAPYAQVRVKEDDCPFPGWHVSWVWIVASFPIDIP